MTLVAVPQKFGSASLLHGSNCELVNFYFQIGPSVPFIGRQDHCLGTYSAKNNISTESKLTVFIFNFSDMNALMPAFIHSTIPLDFIEYLHMHKQWIPGHSWGRGGVAWKHGYILLIVVNDHCRSP